MSAETTTTTLDDLTNPSLIQPYIVRALSEVPGFAGFAKEFNLIGQPTKTAKIPVENSFWGSPADRGAGVDTEFDQAELTDVPNVARSTGVVTIAAGEYGVAHELEDKVPEDSIPAWDLLIQFDQRMLHVLLLAMDDDFIALFAGLSNVVGTTNVDLTVAQLLQVQSDLLTRGVQAEGMVYVLDNKQAADINAALIGTNAAQAIYAMAADRILSWQPMPSLTSRQISTFRGYPVFVSGLTDTANAAVDVVGAGFVPSTAVNDNFGHTTFGAVWKRLPRFEMERHAKRRTSDFVMTARWGVGEMLDGSGSAIITNAAP
ncbi:MAG TPA: hypothetical protein VK607_10690 [Kofleriaceae bacterium]|nr:hypothetical protein [Kofleriaceae bacterium]